MKYTLTLEADCPKEIWDSIYLFKDWNIIDYEEKIITWIKFERWAWNDEAKFEYSAWDWYYYSDKFYPNLENKDYYERIWNMKHYWDLGKTVIWHHSYFNNFYTKEWAELQKQWRIKFKKIKLEEDLKNKQKELEEFLELIKD